MSVVQISPVGNRLRPHPLDTVVIVIPAYEPDDRLVRLVEELRVRAPECEILVVDDGSGPRYARVFERAVSMGAVLIGTPVNQGKAHALRAGFAWTLQQRPGRGVVCVDSDGQHQVHDVLRVAAALGEHGTSDGDGANGPGPMVVLGGRRFTGVVPARSRFGNAVSRLAFRFATGRSITDTQTGLRGYPPSALPWLLEVPGERFAYELQILLDATARGYGVEEIPVDTVYLEHNASSHFRPVVDSGRVLLPLLLYGASSFVSFLIDTVALLLLHTATNSLLVSAVGARIMSAGANFALNRRLVFAGRSAGTTSLPLRAQLLRYAALATSMLAANIVVLQLLTALGLPLLGAKVVAEVLLYLVSFQVQRVFVFGRGRRLARRSEAERSVARTDSSRPPRVPVLPDQLPGTRQGPAGQPPLTARGARAARSTRR